MTSRSKYLSLFAMLFVASCGMLTVPSGQELIKGHYGPYPTNYQDIVRGYLSTQLKDAYSAQINWTMGPTPVKRYSKYGYAVCAQINAKNSFGAYTGSRLHYFVIHGGIVYAHNAGEKIGVDTDMYIRVDCDNALQMAAALKKADHGLYNKLMGVAGGGSEPAPGPKPESAFPTTQQVNTASSGSNFDETAIEFLTPGETSLTDAIAILGANPTSTSYMNGNTVATWQYIEVQGVSVVNESNMIAIMFDSSDIMIRVVLTQGIDPSIVPKQQATSTNLSSSSYGRIGVTISYGNYIQSVDQGSAAADANIQQGDKIVSVNDRNVGEDMGLAVSLLRGTKGENVKVVIRRGNTDKEYLLTRR